MFHCLLGNRTGSNMSFVGRCSDLLAEIPKLSMMFAKKLLQISWLSESLRTIFPSSIKEVDEFSCIFLNIVALQSPKIHGYQSCQPSWYPHSNQIWPYKTIWRIYLCAFCKWREFLQFYRRHTCYETTFHAYFPFAKGIIVESIICLKNAYEVQVHSARPWIFPQKHHSPNSRLFFMIAYKDVSFRIYGVKSAVPGVPKKRKRFDRG